jgi:hypothetical protein
MLDNCPVVHGRTSSAVSTTADLQPLQILGRVSPLSFYGGGRTAAWKGRPTGKLEPVLLLSVWIIPDDMSANFSCYGESAIETPNVDQLAADGVTFTNAYVTAPVCSTCRSAFITGMYQTSIGAHHHRSGRGERKIHLPEGIRLVPRSCYSAKFVQRKNSMT